MKILTIGQAMQDVIIDYKEGSALLIQDQNFPQLTWKDGTNTKVERVSYASGGGAINSALSFKRWGCDVSSCFKIGNDSGGKCIVEDLEYKGISTTAFIHEKEQTGISFSVPTTETDRVTLSYHGANIHLSHKDISESLLALHDCVYISSLPNDAGQALPYLVHAARKAIQRKGIRVVVHPSAQQAETHSAALKASLADIDILIVNLKTMNVFMESLKTRFFQSSGAGLRHNGPSLMRTVLAHNKMSFTLHEFITELFSYGLRRVVILDESNGAYVATHDYIYFHPQLPVDTASTLGAEDAFGSCFVACLLEGQLIEQALLSATIQTASVLLYEDGHSGLLTKTQLLDEQELLDETFLQKYELNYQS